MLIGTLLIGAVAALPTTAWADAAATALVATQTAAEQAPAPEEPTAIAMPRPLLAAYALWLLAALAALLRAGLWSPSPRRNNPADAPTTPPHADLAPTGSLAVGMMLLAMVLTILAGQLGAVLGSATIPEPLTPPAGSDPGLAMKAWTTGWVYAAQAATLGVLLWSQPWLGHAAGLAASRSTRAWASHTLRGAAAFAVVYPFAWIVGVAALELATRLAPPGETLDATAHTVLRALAADTTPAAWWAMTALVVIGAPLLEEVIYRGLLQGAIRRATGSRWAAILGASVLFVAVHAGSVEVFAMPVLAVLSVGFGIARERTGSVWPAVVMHALFNAANVLIVATGA